MGSIKGFVSSGALVIGLAAAALSDGPAVAQDRTGTVEITPFGGGYFGGRLYAGSNAIFSRDVDIATAPTYGLRVATNVNRWMGIEASFARAEPDIKARSGDVLFGSSTKLGEMRVNQYDLNAVFNMGKRRVIPYITLGAGATTLKPRVPGVDASNDTRFSANIGFGLKSFFNPHVGLRFDARGRGTYVNTTRCGSGSTVCSDNDRFRDDNRRWYGNGEVTGGLTAAF